MGRKIRVMVVDDDAVLRKLLSDQIARMGFDSAPAASGEEALDALSKSDFDVVLYVTWAGLALAYYSSYPIGFYVTTIAFVLYLAANVAASERRVPRLAVS